MFSRLCTEMELQINQLQQKQLPLQIDFATSQNNTLGPVYYLIKHKEVSPHQKQDSHLILADYDSDQFSHRTLSKGSGIFVKSSKSLFFNSTTPFQTKFKTPIEKHHEFLHQQPLLFDDTDVESDDVTIDFHGYSSNLNPNQISNFFYHYNPKTSTTSTPVFDITEPSNFLHIVLESYPSMTHPSSSTNIFSTLYDWLRHNTKPEFPTSPKHGSSFLLRSLLSHFH